MTTEALIRTYPVVEDHTIQPGQISFLNGQFHVRSFKDLDRATEIDLANLYRLSNERMSPRAADAGKN